ncbi:hypothetical protein K438DRAFT_2013837 [Mycena galopus ATCC 62051]|nr:hypothetical protein K438DRAFT_2013837 [Mycena galopus ATCC 62051]
MGPSDGKLDVKGMRTGSSGIARSLCRGKVTDVEIAKLWPDVEENPNRGKPIVKRALNQRAQAKAPSNATAESTTKAKAKPKKEAEKSEEEEDDTEGDVTTMRRRAAMIDPAHPATPPRPLIIIHAPVRLFVHPALLHTTVFYCCLLLAP